jgi:hypothetical protein
MYQAREFVDARGLMSYGANLDDLFRRTATYVDKMLKGGEAGGLARRTTDQVRAGHQSEGCESGGTDDQP